MLVTFDGERAFTALDNGGYWNGFLCPIFDKATAYEIAEYVIGITNPFDYETANDYIIDTTPMRTANGWTIGAYGWAWQEWQGVK